MDKNLKLLEYMDEFVSDLREQLTLDDKRWGETWRHRSREGQELRVLRVYTNYFDQYIHAGSPIPWLKIVGNAYIAWVREKHPESLIDKRREKSE